MTTSFELATNVSKQELDEIERHLDTSHELGRRALPPVLEWGPAHLRADYEKIDVATSNQDFQD